MGADVLPSGLPGTAGFLDILDIISVFHHNKSGSVLQLVNDKSRNLQKLLKYFYGIATSVSNASVLFDMLSINFVLYSKSLKNCSALIYQIISIMILILIIIYSISTKIPQSS